MTHHARREASIVIPCADCNHAFAHAVRFGPKSKRCAACSAEHKKRLAKDRCTRYHRKMGILSREQRYAPMRKDADRTRQLAIMSNLRKQIATMMRRCDDIDREISMPLMPWRADGCPTRKAWSIAKPHRAREYASFLWRRAYLNWKRRIGCVAVGEWDFWSWQRKLAEFGNCCAYCGVTSADAARAGHVLEADHLFALALPETRPDLAHCCTNHIRNVVPACKTCNTSKSDNYVMDWILRTGRSAAVNPLVRHYHDMAVRGEAVDVA